VPVHVSASLAFGWNAVAPTQEPPLSRVTHSVTHVAYRTVCASEGCTLRKEACRPRPYACAAGGLPVGCHVAAPSVETHALPWLVTLPT